MKARRPYKVTVRFQGRRGGVTCTRTVGFGTRERAFRAATTRLADAIANRWAGTDPARYDVTVFGPDKDLQTGRIIRHDGTEVDLMTAAIEAAETARQHLYDAGWTDEDIERGRRAPGSPVR